MQPSRCSRQGGVASTIVTDVLRNDPGPHDAPARSMRRDTSE